MNTCTLCMRSLKSHTHTLCYALEDTQYAGRFKHKRPYTVHVYALCVYLLCFEDLYGFFYMANIKTHTTPNLPPRLFPNCL